MKQYHYSDIEALQELVSDDFGDWGRQLEITQSLIDRFADMTGDDYWLHTDPEKAASDSPFGCTVAHGFLTLVMLPAMRGKPQWELTGYNNMLNYGSDKLRFTGAVPVGCSIHCRSRVREVSSSAKGTKMVLEQHVHVVGQEQRPALIYQMILVYV